MLATQRPVKAEQPTRKEARNYINNEYSKGLRDERRVVRYLSSLGVVTDSSTEENIHEDIDCYLDDVPVSIKAQHSGVAYNNIYFEIEQLHVDGNWEPSWFITGRATVYAILQGDTLRVYQKQDIVDYVAANGWSYERTLSREKRAMAQYNKRYIDARIGFLRPNDIPHKQYLLPALTTY